jgi:methyl-accepting chemotaxis protein
MSSSIAEISAQTANADRLATEAQQQMNAGRDASQRLGQTAVEIEDVAKAIAAIAGQTNLLALNATIEAASAGEAGRGFAVVAGEVKTLARRAHEATLDISKRITAVQQDSSTVEQAMAGIAGSIQRLAQATSSIAAAIEEQTAVTHELSTSSTHVADSAREAGTAATEVDSVAVRIGAVNTAIEKAVQVFRTGG